jgi:peptide/nickel transport system ATP-binding protein
MSSVSVRDLRIRYGAMTAVDGISFDVPAGKTLGLVGESGSGKSTVARAVVGLVGSSGVIELDGTDVSSVSSRAARRARRSVQMVFQDSRSSLDPRYTVEQCIAEGFARRPRRAAMTARVGELLELVSLDPQVATARPATLSGGQRQRIAIARALAAEPRTLIADEVTASLDVSVQAVVLNLLRRLRGQLGLTMIFISHNLAIVRYMCDDLAVMYHGRIVESGSVEEVIAAPEHPYTQSLLAAVPQIGERRLLSNSSVETSAAIADATIVGGCAYRLRCPIGPAVDPDRDVCVRIDPATVADSRAHHASCHYAPERDNAMRHVSA